MEMRQLGRSALRVAPLVFGGNVFGWTIDRETSFSLLDAFVDAGLNFIDTADMYSEWKPGNQGGESETIIGEWLRRSGRRNQVVIATKVGHMKTFNGLSAANIARAVENSLRRLGTDRIDVYFAHRDDSDVPLEETLTAFARLVELGKVTVIGASNYTAPRLQEALQVSKRLGLPRYEVLQPHYNLAERADYEGSSEPVALAEGLGVVPYYSLASGFLTGKYRSDADLEKSVRGGSAKRYLTPGGLRILKALDEVSEAHGSTPAVVALAWLIARPSITAPIASATSLAQLSEIAQATALKLLPDEIGKLDRASAEGAAA
ncbi:MAG: aldo/keto reductase [Janthinobacterium lividum]